MKRIILTLVIVLLIPSSTFSLDQFLSDPGEVVCAPQSETAYLADDLVNIHDIYISEFCFQFISDNIDIWNISLVVYKTELEGDIVYFVDTPVYIVIGEEWYYNELEVHNVSISTDIELGPGTYWFAFSTNADSTIFCLAGNNYNWEPGQFGNPGLSWAEWPVEIDFAIKLSIDTSPAIIAGSFGAIKAVYR